MAGAPRAGDGTIILLPAALYYYYHIINTLAHQNAASDYSVQPVCLRTL